MWGSKGAPYQLESAGLANAYTIHGLKAFLTANAFVFFVYSVDFD